MYNKSSMEMNKENIFNVMKRKRSANWDSLEKHLLRGCVKEFMAIIENKNTNTNTNKAKHSAWLKITRRFNEINSRQRTVVEIKQQWRTIKWDMKKKLLNYQREHNATRGREKPLSPDPVRNEILQMILQEFEVDCNKLDSVKIRDQVLIDTIQMKHQLKMKQTIEAHEWAKIQHELRLKEVKLHIKELKLENELLNLRLNKKDI